MITFAALAVAVTVGGTDFDDALSRAQRYAKDPNAVQFINGALLPRVGPELNRVLNGCAGRFNLKLGDGFALVVSYRDGHPDRIVLKKDEPFGRCVAEGFATLAFPPTPPFADFAQSLEFKAEDHPAQ